MSIAAKTPQVLLCLPPIVVFNCNVITTQPPLLPCLSGGSPSAHARHQIRTTVLQGYTFLATNTALLLPCPCTIAHTRALTNAGSGIRTSVSPDKDIVRACRTSRCLASSYHGAQQVLVQVAHSSSLICLPFCSAST